MTIDDACWLCLEPIEGQRMNGGHPYAGVTPAGWLIVFAAHPECFETYRDESAGVLRAGVAR